MALSLNPATKLISIPQADLTFVSGQLYTLDTDAFRKNVMTLLASEAYIWMPDAYRHNTQVTVAGTTYARTIEFINGYSVQFQDTGAAYTVRLEGSNNNIFDVQNGILTPTPLVTVISTNAAGLIDVAITAADKTDIVNAVFARVLEAGETFEEAMRIIRAEAAGTITKTGTQHRIKSADGNKDRIVANADETGRTVTSTDGT